MPPVEPFTVVIPTRDRPRSLELCLAALERQTGCGDFAIVVVDDGSRAREDVAAVVAASPRARLVRTAPRGASIARNVGARESETSVVLFLDDDCLPEPAWAAALVRAVEAGAVVVAGSAVNSSRSDAYGEATQVVLDYLTEAEAGHDGTTAFAPTYNLACRRELLLEEPFEEWYENAGADRDWCARLAARGMRIARAESAVVTHLQVLDLSRFLSKHFTYGSGSQRFRRRHHLGLERPSYYARLVRSGFARGGRVGLAVCLAQVATAAGFVAGSLGHDVNRGGARPREEGRPLAKQGSSRPRR